MSTLRKFWNDDQDQEVIEYSLLMAFLALASAALVLTAAGSISGIWSVPNNLLAATHGWA